MQLSFQTVQLSPCYGARVPLGTVLAAAAAAGFTGVGLDIWSVESYLEVGATLAELGRLLARLGLSCTDVLPLIISRDHAKTIDAARHLAELASATSDDICGVAIAPDIIDPLAGGVRDLVRDCSEIMGRDNVRLAIEFVPDTPLKTVAAARELCEWVGWDRAGVMLDCWHTLVTEQLPEVCHLPDDAVALVQFSDTVTPMSRDMADESRNHRVLPGHGNLELCEFVEVVGRLGYRGVVSAEVLSSQVRAAPPTGFARDLHRTMTAYWQEP